jgi:hypothetical protein
LTEFLVRSSASPTFERSRPSHVNLILRRDQLIFKYDRLLYLAFRSADGLDVSLMEDVEIILPDRKRQQKTDFARE